MVWKYEDSGSMCISFHSNTYTAMNNSPMSKSLDDSDLKRNIIPPEIRNDVFYQLISWISAMEDIKHVLEIGSSSGGGSTEAFVRGLAANPGSPNLHCLEISKARFEVLSKTYAEYDFVKCHNMSSISVDEFPTEEEVRRFYRDENSRIRQYPIDEVLRWLRQDIQYVSEGGVETGAIEHIKRENGIVNFDLVLINGSQFAGDAEFEKLQGAKIIILDDTCTFKTWNVRKRLLADSDYVLVVEDNNLRNGFAVFRRRDVNMRSVEKPIPVHFFTIVLNGNPFIQYHESILPKLWFNWHWHIVEGVASLSHDTAWSVKSGGRVDDSFHLNGRSIDGTSEYLDNLAARYPDNITIYRKPDGVFWEGKREMCNAPLANIHQECLLWQIDSDEFWTAKQISAVHRLFTEQADRTAAVYWCDFFVGPEKVVSTRYNYSQNPAHEWRRTWRFKPGDHWIAHEPPKLRRPRRLFSRKIHDLSTARPFTPDETEAIGAVFKHFAYVTSEQLAFKEKYYGYSGASERWRELQQVQSPGFLRDYFSWVRDTTMFDDAAKVGVDQIPRFINAQWVFNHKSTQMISRRSLRVLVDGVCFQHEDTTASRMWVNILRAWISSGFADHVVLIDRAGTAPRIGGLHLHPMMRHDYARTGPDSLHLQQLCDKLDADLFISTYYTTPTTTPSLFLCHDMSPEALGIDQAKIQWREKHRAIKHANWHVAISQNCAYQLERLAACVQDGTTIVARMGIDPVFKPANPDVLDEFRRRFNLDRPWIHLPGERVGVGGHKNGELLFRAIAAIPDKERYTLFCSGGSHEIEPRLAALTQGAHIRHGELSDADIVCAYTGAHACVYPSRYENLGIQVMEAMACGSPVIACRSPGVEEASGDAAIFVSDNDAHELILKILELETPQVRNDWIRKGAAHVLNFRYDQMAETLVEAIAQAVNEIAHGRRTCSSGLGWEELRRKNA